MSLAIARVRRDDARKAIGEGIDPVEAKRARKREKKLQAENSFEYLAREWHEQQKGRWTADHAARVLESLEKEIFPQFGSKPILDVIAPLILEAVRKIEKRAALDVASRVLQRVRAVFRYAIQTGRAKQNPAADLVGVLKTRKVQHRTALERAELPEFLAKLQAYEGQSLTRQALQLIILTFVRSRELRGARWEEFDLERMEWRIPAERMKMSAPHLVPLSTQAVDVIARIRSLTGNYDLVFPAQTSLRKPMSENTLLYAMYRMGYHKRATVHGFRATASTILNETGFPCDAIERQLAHVERNKVRAAYHRSEYLEERRKMMQWWGDYVDGLTNGANVVPLRAKDQTV